MSPLPPKLASTLRLLRHPSRWQWLERFIKEAYFVPIHDCGDFTELNSTECNMAAQTDIPRSKMTKTGIFARIIFPGDAKQIDEIRERRLATKKALNTAEKLAGDGDAQGRWRRRRAARETRLKTKLDTRENLALRGSLILQEMQMEMARKVATGERRAMRRQGQGQPEQRMQPARVLPGTLPEDAHELYNVARLKTRRALWKRNTRGYRGVMVGGYLDV